MTCAQILPRPVFANFGEALDWETAHNQVPYELPITLPEAAWCALPDAINELNHMVRIVSDLLSHLAEFLSQNSGKDFGIVAVVELAKRGLDHASEHEAALLDEVEMVLRQAVARMKQDMADSEAERKSK